MGIWILMVMALLGAFVIPAVCGMTKGAMIASHLCVLTVTLVIFFGTLTLNKDRRSK